MKYCDKIVNCELTTDDMLEKEVYSTTEEVATPIKKGQSSGRKKAYLHKRKYTLQRKELKRFLITSQVTSHSGYMHVP